MIRADIRCGRYCPSSPVGKLPGRPLERPALGRTVAPHRARYRSAMAGFQIDTAGSAEEHQLTSTRSRTSRFGFTAALVASVLVPVVLAAPSPAAAATVPSGFQEQIVFSGLVNPTNIEFASDGRVFVLEKGGKIKIFDSLADPTPTVFADLSGEVMDYWDRGALGLALDPNFPASPYVYVSYTLDAGPGQTPPVFNDACADPTGQGCVVTSRVSRLTAVGNTMSGPEQVLLTDWCQQFPSHSIGDLHFG